MQQAHGRGVTQDVRSDLLGGQRGAGGDGFGGVDGQALLQRVVAERPAAAGDKQRVARFSAAFGGPGRSVVTVPGVSGVIRSFRPLPWQAT
jgi:hypothetical protein